MAFDSISVISIFVYELFRVINTLVHIAVFVEAKVTIKTVNHAQPTNLYFIFVGYPGTGKSAAIEHGCMKPLHKIMQEDFNNCVIERSTSSGLVKHLANNGNGFIVSPEVYDVLYNFLKDLLLASFFKLPTTVYPRIRVSTSKYTHIYITSFTLRTYYFMLRSSNYQRLCIRVSAYPLQNIPTYILRHLS